MSIFSTLFILHQQSATLLTVLILVWAWLVLYSTSVLMRLFLALLALILILSVFGLLFCTILWLGLIQILSNHLFLPIFSFQSFYSMISQIFRSKSNYFICPIQLQDLFVSGTSCLSSFSIFAFHRFQS